MTPADALQRGRESFGRQSWAVAYSQLSDADRVSPLDPEDLERLATAAYLLGKDSESAEILARTHHEFLNQGNIERAIRCAFWLAHGLLNKGEAARGGGWLARAQRLLDECGSDCVEQGYVLVPDAIRSIMQGDAATGYTLFSQIGEIGARYGNRELTTLSLLGRGRALIRQRKIAEGVPLLDEAMAAVEAGDASPIIAGEVYCAVIEACQEIFDLRRAQEWTEALSQWCESQPDLVPFRGQCQIRRAEIMQLHGAWPDALEEAERACERLARPPAEAAAGAAFYQKAELHRLRGEFEEAAEAYSQAGRWMRKPRPGPALLRLAQGDVEAATAAIRRALSEANEFISRSAALPPYIDIMLAAGDVEAARAAADELSEIALANDAPYLRAIAAHAEGAVRLSEGNAGGALEILQRARSEWMELDAPYEAARVRVLIGLAYAQLGDPASAELDFDAARVVFHQLGATPDLARVEALADRGTSAIAHGLTARELEVLRLVAAGETNKRIASDLFISERTVERHLSNIFSKLDVSSRTAAASFAFAHGLLE